MSVENGEWIMHGMQWEDPDRIRSCAQLMDWINDIGFLPLFKNEIDGFSVEEHAAKDYWWSGDQEQDPWEWRGMIARTGEIAYGKFFHNKTGFISRKWLPYFVNYRRGGYDFDSRWDDELASIRCKKIMDCFANRPEYASYDLKSDAGFGKGGEKNFDGILTLLQMQCYLTIKDFRYRKNKQGADYGWSVSIYTTPEALWGQDFIRSHYDESPALSGESILHQVKALYPSADDKLIRKVILG